MDKKSLLEEHYRKEYSVLVKRSAYRLGNNTALAEDTVQEAYAKALKYLERYNPEYEFGGWFDKILKNTIKDMQKLDRENGIVHDNFSVDPVGDEVIAKSELMEYINAEKKRNRELLTMFFFEGFNARQVSEFLGMTHTNVRQIINRFRDRLIEAPAGVD